MRTDKLGQQSQGIELRESTHGDHDDATKLRLAGKALLAAIEAAGPDRFQSSSRRSACAEDDFNILKLDAKFRHADCSLHTCPRQFR